MVDNDTTYWHTTGTREIYKINDSQRIHDFRRKFKIDLSWLYAMVFYNERFNWAEHRNPMLFVEYR